jgi:phage baseplate assembly protein W
MSGITPKLPLIVDKTDGHYRLIKDYISLVKQNMKNLLLTSPGERIMMPDFGVGVRNFLFEQDSGELRGALSSRISAQTKKYMPFVKILNIDLYAGDDSQSVAPNTLSVQIEYVIIPLQTIDKLEINTPNY